jgi:hypothetical protein
MTVADVTGAAMLRQLTTDLGQDGIRLAVAPTSARLATCSRTRAALPVAYSTVDEAVAAVLNRPTPS